MIVIVTEVHENMGQTITTAEGVREDGSPVTFAGDWRPTQEQREVRWAESRARQEAYRNSPEARIARTKRIAEGLCVIEEIDRGRHIVSWCITHDEADTMAHHMAQPGADND